MNDAAIAEQLHRNEIRERNQREEQADDAREEENAKKDHEDRMEALKKMNDAILRECGEYYKYWKENATSVQKNKGLEDYQQMKRDEDFKMQEMLTMKTNFWRAAGK